MSCRGCFAHYGHIDELGSSGWMNVLDIIANETEGRYRVKLMFAGGEPTLLPFLAQLIKHGHGLGMLTGIISNGSLIDEGFLDRIHGSIGWVGLSVDSIVESTNKILGRVYDGKPISAGQYMSIASGVKQRCILLKINTVVNSLNHSEDFSGFIETIAPDRWKVMQHLVVQGQNEGSSAMAVDSDSYNRFVTRHRGVRTIVPETAASMLASYIMVDPSGRPYGNEGGRVRFSECILQKGLLKQAHGLGYTRDATDKRGGFYY